MIISNGNDFSIAFPFRVIRLVAAREKCWLAALPVISTYSYVSEINFRSVGLEFTTFPIQPTSVEKRETVRNRGEILNSELRGHWLLSSYVVFPSPSSHRRSRPIYFIALTAAVPTTTTEFLQVRLRFTAAQSISIAKDRKSDLQFVIRLELVRDPRCGWMWKLLG